MTCCTSEHHPNNDDARPDASATVVPRSPRLTVGGSVVAAVLSSACCWLPLLLLAFGASAAGVSAFFERWRPALLVSAAGLLATGFYVVYRRRDSCVDGTCVGAPRSPRTLSKAILWIAALFVAAFALFPTYAGHVARALYGSRDANGPEAVVAGMPVHHFRVEGMSCEACATTLEAELSRLDGGAAARVDYTSRTAAVHSDAAEIVAKVRAAAERLGYRATPR